MTFWLGFILGALAAWLLIGLALTAYLISSLKSAGWLAVVLPLLLAGCSGNFLVVSAASYHEDRSKPYNESHNIVALQIPINEEWRLVGGQYENSLYQPSRFAAAMWLPIRGEHWRVGAMAGAVDGYDPDDRSKPVALASPVIAYERRKWGLEFLPFNGDVLTLLLKLRF